MFSIWIGTKPGAKELECLTVNNERYGITLVASQNWIGAKNFKLIDTVVEEAISDSRVRKLWEAFPEPAYRADVLRLWYLWQNPFEVYVDADCLVHDIPASTGEAFCPSIQALMERIAAKFGAVPDMDGIQNSTGQWLDVWMVVGAGNAAFFSAWLDLWVKDFFRPGGIAEALSHGPFKVSVLPVHCYAHFSNRKATFKPLTESLSH